MKTKHTKGEWIRDYNHVWVLGKLTTKYGKEIDVNLFSCTVSNDNHLLSLEEIEANAKLIAAAPVLLQTLKELADECEMICSMGSDPKYKNMLMKWVNATNAIKKATE